MWGPLRDTVTQGMPTLLSSCITKCEHLGKWGMEKWCNEDKTSNCWKGDSLQEDLLLVTHWCFQKKSLECMEFSGMPGCKHYLVNQGLKICCPVTIDYSESKIADLVRFWEVPCSTQTARAGGIVSPSADRGSQSQVYTRIQHFYSSALPRLWNNYHTAHFSCC